AAGRPVRGVLDRRHRRRAAGAGAGGGGRRVRAPAGRLGR
ncbi:MAG: hypothetical protein AVDCRST_MAG41-130, partial [uncultured Corynebacteriales bacterium]